MEAGRWYIVDGEAIEINAGRSTVTIDVANEGDRPIQVGSHAHFFEVNRSLGFDRAEAFGMRLHIPSGTAVRFEPGQYHTVTLVAFGGARIARGMNSLVDGESSTSEARNDALASAEERGYVRRMAR